MIYQQVSSAKSCGISELYTNTIDHVYNNNMGNRFFGYLWRMQIYWANFRNTTSMWNRDCCWQLMHNGK